FNLTIGTLHPRHGARSYVWQPQGLTTDEFSRHRRAAQLEGYLRSPTYHLRSSGELRLRRRLDTGAPHDFPVLADLAAAGMTEYAAHLVRFDDARAATLRPGLVT